LDITLYLIIQLIGWWGYNYVCTDDCCPPNHCPYDSGCVTKQDRLYCINPENNLSYMEEIEKGIKLKDWDLQ